MQCHGFANGLEMSFFYERCKTTNNKPTNHIQTKPQITIQQNKDKDKQEQTTRQPGGLGPQDPSVKKGPGAYASAPTRRTPGPTGRLKHPNPSEPTKHKPTTNKTKTRQAPEVRSRFSRSLLRGGTKVQCHGFANGLELSFFYERCKTTNNKTTNRKQTNHHRPPTNKNKD